MNEVKLKQKYWSTVAIRDVVFRDTSKLDSDSNNIHRWVAADHLDEGDIHVHRWGDIKDPQFPPTFRFTFKAGCVLIHSRNPKKIAIPDFDGITGEKFFALKSKDEQVLRTDYLAFVLFSSPFTEWVQKWLSGSVNKFLNWSTFERFEFQIPSLAEQNRIMILLWAAEDCIVKGERFVTAAERAKQVLMRELFSRGIGHTEFQKTDVGLIPKDWKIESTKNIGDIKTGPFGTLLKANEYSAGDGIPLICMRDIQDGVLEIDDKTPRISRSVVNRMPEYVLKSGDLVFGRKGNINRSAIVKDNQDGWFLGTDGIRIRLLKSFHPPFISHYFQRNEIQSWLLHNATGTTMASLNQEILGRIVIPDPPLNEQRQIASILTQCDETIAAARMNVAAMRALKMRLINEMLCKKPI